MAPSVKFIPAIRRSEVDLLLCCARTRLGSETTERIHSLVQKGIDWEYLFQTAFRHRVVPLLYQSLKKICPQALSDDIIEEFRRHSLENGRRNLYLTGELLKLLDLLEAHGILAIPFKGLVLAQSVYGDLSLRAIADLDILVHKRDALRARNLFMSHGYLSQIKPESGQDKGYMDTEYYFSLFSEDNKVMVDLHWEMTGHYSLFPMDLEGLMGHFEPVALAGKKVRHLSPEELLLYLCLHGSRDLWEALELVCCVSELIQSRPDMDWGRVAHLAGEMHCERILFLGLLLAHQLLEAPLPGWVLERIQGDLKLRKLAAGVWKRLFHANSNPSDDRIPTPFSFFHMQVRDSFTDGMHYMVRRVMRPSVIEWIYFPLPAYLSFLHYLLRPMRLALTLGLGLMKRLVLGSRTIEVGGSLRSRSTTFEVGGKEAGKR